MARLGNFWAGWLNLSRNCDSWHWPISTGPFEEEVMKRQLDSYPLWLCCWHWSNAFLFVILLITGLSLHYSHPGPPPLTFRVDIFIHNTAGVLLTLFYLLFLGGNLWLGNGRYYKITANDLNPGLWRQP